MSRDRSACLLDLALGARGHGDALDHEPPPGDLTGAEQLDRMVGTAHQAGAEQRLRRHLDAVGEQDEGAHIHDLRRLLERIGEAALGNAPDERHLAALETRTHLAAMARRLALASTAAGPAGTAAPAPAYQDRGPLRPDRPLQ